MDFAILTQACAPQVAHATIAAIVKTESDFQPLAISINNPYVKLTRQPKNKGEAIATAKWLIRNGYNIDLGLGQVNFLHLSKFNLEIEDAFDPCRNLAVSASILHRNYHAASAKIKDEQAALRSALSAYNTGSFIKGFSNGYVQRVLNNSETSSNVPAILPVEDLPKNPPIPVEVKKLKKIDSPVKHANSANVYSNIQPQPMVYK